MITTDDWWREARVTLRASLSAKGQRDALRKGFDPLNGVEVTFTPDDSEWSRVAALELPLQDGGDIVVEVGRSWVIQTDNVDVPNAALPGSKREILDDFFGSSDWPKPCAEIVWGAPEPLDFFPSSPADLLEFEEVHQGNAVDALETKNEDLADLIKLWRGWLEKLRSEATAKLSVWQDDSHTRMGLLMSTPTMQLFRTRVENFDPEFAENAEVAELLRAHDAAEEAVKKVRADIEKYARQRLEEAEAAAWIADHGTPRLKKACDLGMLSSLMGVYRDHRLEMERPGWEWFTANIKHVRDVHNPSEIGLDLLAEARTWDKQARLRWLNSEDEFGGGNEIVFAEFLGRTAVWHVAAAGGYNDEEPF